MEDVNLIFLGALVPVVIISFVVTVLIVEILSEENDEITDQLFRRIKYLDREGRDNLSDKLTQLIDANRTNHLFHGALTVFSLGTWGVVWFGYYLYHRQKISMYKDCISLIEQINTTSETNIANDEQDTFKSAA